MIKFVELYGEKEVEHFWWSVLRDFFPNGSLKARGTGNKTDGILVDVEHEILTLIEVKEDLELQKPADQAKVLIQSIFYIKQYLLNGEKVPKTVFIGDKNEAFIIHTNALRKYLDYDVDWYSAPSTAYKKHVDMLMDIIDDTNINPFVFDITVPDFNFYSIMDKLIELNQNVKRLIKITDRNIQQVFDYFIQNVLGKNKMDTNEQVNLFINLIINPSENYLHPRKANTVITKDFGEVLVNKNKFNAFFTHFDGEQYSVLQKEKLVSIVDRLVEDESRKRNGEFFTPTIWVDEAHKMISEEFGPNWKEEYIVWDCAWGTGNLTRDYKFKELYCSSLHDSDINTANQMKINMEATKFQFDFLNDDLSVLETKAPKLLEAINEGKDIIFLINPPYARSSGSDKVSNVSVGIANTMMGEEMKNDNCGSCSSNIYAQFLYRIYQIQLINKKIRLSFFSPPLFLSGVSFKKFRNNFFSGFGFKYGFLFQASNFSDVSTTWGISFTIFDNVPILEKNNFVHDLIEYSEEDGELIKISKKNIYNLDNKEILSTGLKKDIKKNKKIETPQLSSGLKIKNQTGDITCVGAFGSFMNKMNTVYVNQTNVGLFTSSSPKGNGGVSILPLNIMKVFSVFSLRKLINQNWINQKDEYIAPTEEVQESLEYKQFNNDAIIYSLFQSNSNQSSMRQVDYKDKKWDIKNEFFWLSREGMMKLSDTYYFDDVYQDARSSEDRFVYKLLNGKLSEEEFKEVGITHVDERNRPILSEDAQELINLSKKIIIKSFKVRKMVHEEHPEYHLNTFDAGWYQIKKVAQEYFKDDYKEFTDAYKAFGDRLRPKVYELGFLLK